MNRLKTESEINNELQDIKKKKKELKNRLECLKNNQEELEDLKEQPLGPACPICGKICKNLKGLKIHIKLKKKNEFDGPHRNALLKNEVHFNNSGKVVMKCKNCGDRVVLNGRREDRRILDDGGVFCVTCRNNGGDIDG